MSELLVVVPRRPGNAAGMDDARLKRLANLLRPEGVIHEPPVVWQGDFGFIAILAPIGNEGSVNDFRLGGVRHVGEGWYQHIRGAVDESVVSISTDRVASRTLWFGSNDIVSVASTSLRAAVFAFGTFEFDPRPWSWMLPAGNLGPRWSWDRRLEQVPADSTVLLEVGRPPKVKVGGASTVEREVRSTLDEVLREAVGGLRLSEEWTLPLSGGVDSRALALLLSDGVPTVTWGTRLSSRTPGSDSVVASELASVLDTSHEFLELESSECPVELFLERFVAASEGRIDHFSGYVDGFALWRKLHDSGARGILRGDQVFGWRPVPNEFAARRSLDVIEFAEVSNLQAFENIVPSSWSLGDARNRRPAPDEALEDWRDWMQRSARAPAVLAALTTVKSKYVEVLNPLLHGSIVDFVEKLPAKERTDKTALRRWVTANTPPVAFAREASLESRSVILRDPELVAAIRAAVSTHAGSLEIPPEIRAMVLQGLVTKSVGEGSKEKSSVRARVLKRAPKRLTRWLAYRNPRLTIDENRLGFRILLGVRASQLLERDARAGAQ